MFPHSNPSNFGSLDGSKCLFSSSPGAGPIAFCPAFPFGYSEDWAFILDMVFDRSIFASAGMTPDGVELDRMCRSVEEEGVMARLCG